MVPRLSLRTKLMVSVIAVVVLSSIPSTVVIESKMSATLKSELNQRAVAIAHELAAQSVDLVLTYNTYELHDLVHTIQSSNNGVRYVFIVDSKARLLVHTFEEGFPMDLLKIAGLGPGEALHTRLLDTEQGPLLDVAVPIYQGKGGTAHVGMSYDLVRKTVEETMRSILMTISAGLAIVLALTYFSAGIVLRPLGKLMAAVGEIHRGHLQHRSGVRSRDEIGQLGQAFDAMAEELEHSRNELLRTSRLEAQWQMDNIRTEFLARASHELRTPVAAIQGYVETLRRSDMDLDEKTQAMLFEDMERISDRLSRLVKDLLNVSRIDVGELKPSKKKVDLELAAGRAIRRFKMQAPGHDFVTKLPKGLPPALADPDLLDDVLDNLLANAVKYSPRGTPITITAELQTHPEVEQSDVPSLIVLVEDEGIGIPATELDRVFQRFYQRTDGAIGGRGIGLGLYLCRTYVEAMGGTIWAMNRPDKGSSFGFALPAAGTIRSGQRSTLQGELESIEETVEVS